MSVVVIQADIIIILTRYVRFWHLAEYFDRACECPLVTRRHPTSQKNLRKFATADQDFVTAPPGFGLAVAFFI